MKSQQIKWLIFWENIVVLVKRLILQYSGWTFLGLLTDGVTKKTPLSRIFRTYPAMMKLGTVVPYLKKI